ncbi:peroxisomal acyl-coenzyme A oxidase 1-like [Ptychodera flava]|uniref:peroxisomal acyl-coenzyme A oxidase 1-like n=1 Tax=Ptychodera flava TaxID=63121 RepID=UPI00396A17C1
MSVDVLKQTIPSKLDVNNDLVHERGNATFDPVQLTYLKDGGRDRTRRRRFLEALALNDPQLQRKIDPAFLTRDDQYSMAVRNGVLTEQKIIELKLSDPEEKEWFRDAAVRLRGDHALSLTYLMFTTTLENQCTEEQKNKWLPLAKNFHIVGTYAQTELGHGTFIRGLETTATYDVEKEVFVINTPTLTAMKWWPGWSGKTSTHAVVMAQLYSLGQCHGVHPFIVQLRSLEDHRLMPGITAGDIGPKLGYNCSDNGFLKFDHVCIPRENMLMKYAKVLPNGQYVTSPNARLAYGTMVQTRVAFMPFSTKRFAAAVTIAVRYSAIRRQSELKPGEREIQILDHLSQQYKLLPQLATVYSLLFTIMRIQQFNERMKEQLNAGNFSSLSEMHAVTAGIKAFITDAVMSGTESCRLACGGHGYSEASGLPNLLTYVALTITGEGENTVMYLQLARYLMKCVAKATVGTKLPVMMSYLQTKQSKRCPAQAESELRNLDLLLQAYECRARSLIYQAAEKLQTEIMEGTPEYLAWNNSHLLLLKAAQAHCHYVAVESYIQFTMATEMADSVREVLVSLCHLYALYGIRENAGDFLQDGYMTGKQFAMVTNQIGAVLSTLRPNAVALVDALDIPDEMLASQLGRYDGNVYENMYKWAQQSSLNKTEVHDSYYKYLRPLLAGKRSKL